MPCLDNKQAMAAQCKQAAPSNYQQIYPASFVGKEKEKANQDGLSWSQQCPRLGHEIENGFAFCNGTVRLSYAFTLYATPFRLLKNSAHAFGYAAKDLNLMVLNMLTVNVVMVNAFPIISGFYFRFR